MNDKNLLKIGIYTITSPSGKKYIGMTAAQSFKARWAQHRKLLKGNRHPCHGLQNAFNKYGFDNLEFEIVSSFDKPCEQKSDLTKLIQAEEIRFWDDFKNEGIKLYNGRPTGTGSVYHTKETRAKIRETINTKNLVQKVIKKHCIYCLSEIFVKNRSVKYCSERCRSHFTKTGSLPMVFSEYPTFEKIKKEMIKTKDLKALSKIFGMKETDIKFFIVEKYGILSIIEFERKFFKKKKRTRKVSCKDKFRTCVFCKESFKIINKSTAEYCSKKCRKEAYHQKKDYVEKPTKKLLEKLYIDEGFSTTQIAEKLNCTQPNVYYLLKKFEIPRRNKNRNNRKI